MEDEYICFELFFLNSQWIQLRASPRVPIFGTPTFRRWFRMLTEFVPLHCRWYVYLSLNTYSFASTRHCLLPTSISYCILWFVHNLNCLSWQLTSCRHIALENLISRVLNVVPFSTFSRLIRTEFYFNFMVCSSRQGDILCTQWVLMVLSWLGRLILANERSLLFFTFFIYFKKLYTM
jgi:hypothetical protein